MRHESDRRGQAADPARASRPPRPGAGTTTRRQRWARLRRSFWQPPRPHGEQPRQRVVGPLELFYDLATVVLVAQAAHHLAGHLTWRGLGEFAVVFTLVWITWINGSLHHELHGRDDARARSTFLLQILVLVAMGAFIPQAGGARGAPFAVATGVLFAILAVLWLLASRGDRPEYRRASRLFVAGTAACAAALVGHRLPAGRCPYPGMGPPRRRLPGRVRRRGPRQPGAGVRASCHRRAHRTVRAAHHHRARRNRQRCRRRIGR
jgi:hypothetical protein